MDAKSIVDYAASLDCIHCGMCVSSCPTWKLTGVESSSPRGRIHLMRAVAEGELEPDADYVEEMEFCLLCRHCESVCPSGVRFGEMMEFARDGITREVGRPIGARFLRWIGFRVLLPHRLLLRAAAFFARIAAPVLGTPSIPPARERRPLPERTAALTDRRGMVSVLEGCVMPLLFGRVNRATVEVLARCGFDVVSPAGQTCCGSLHAHNGDLEGARQLARRTIASFEVGEAVEGEIVVNSAGCSAHMKDYAHLLKDDAAWRERAQAFSARVRDFSEFVASDRCRASLASALARRTMAPAPSSIAYDDPCHLCHGQGVRSQPRKLLDAIPGMRRVEMRDAEACCGSAGIYSLLRPKTSSAVLEPKIAALRESGATTLVTANPGCQMQWEGGLARAGLASAGVRVRVAHIAEILREAL